MKAADAVKEAGSARYRGTTVVWSQDDYDWKTVNRTQEPGCCDVLSQKWLQHVANHRNWQEQFNNADNRTWIAQDQNTLVSLPRNRQTQVQDAAMERSGFTRGRETFRVGPFHRGGDLHDRLRAILEFVYAADTYAIVGWGLRDRATLGHAIAMTYKNNEASLFDPNGGMVHIAKAQFSVWFLHVYKKVQEVQQAVTFEVDDYRHD